MLGLVGKTIGPVNRAKLRTWARGGPSREERYDILTYEVIRKVARPDVAFVDVGCFAGSILKVMMHYAPGGTFYAFEPLPHLHAKLREKFGGDERVHLHSVALSDDTGEAQFNHVVSEPGYSGFRPRRYARPHETEERITVATDRLDRIIPQTARVAMIKIDVEGAELQVLRGARDTILRGRPVVVFEHGLGGADFYGTGPSDIYEFFQECGMRISLLDDWLRGRPPLDLPRLEDEFESNRNYYFIAHPE